MIDIIIANLIFWPIYIWVCMIPYRMFEKALNET